LYLLLCDQVGTPLALATTDDHIVQTMQYDYFGNLLATRGDVVRLPLGFAGKLFDAVMCLTRPFSLHDGTTMKPTPVTSPRWLHGQKCRRHGLVWLLRR